MLHSPHPTVFGAPLGVTHLNFTIKALEYYAVLLA